jgi:hypothetical protein
LDAVRHGANPPCDADEVARRRAAGELDFGVIALPSTDADTHLLELMRICGPEKFSPELQPNRLHFRSHSKLRVLRPFLRGPHKGRKFQHEFRNSLRKDFLFRPQLQTQDRRLCRSMYDAQPTGALAMTLEAITGWPRRDESRTLSGETEICG